MVGHAALDRVIGVRIPASQPILDRGCAPKTPARSSRGPLAPRRSGGATPCVAFS